MKVSIGVPIYCAEKYINRCARSLFEQNYKDIEYIFVDDCSPDKSIDMLKNTLLNYPERSEQVKIIRHDKNKGVACARNTALRYFSGEYIIWVDPDDWLDVNAISILVEIQEKTNCDIITFDSIWHYASRDIVFHDKFVKTPKDALVGIFERTNVNTLWGRFIRKKIYDEHKIFCKPGVNMGEDLQQIIKVLYYSQSIQFCDLPLYHYECTNISSSTSTFSELKIRQSIESLNIVKDFVRGKDAVLMDKFNEYVAYSLTTFMAGSLNNNRCKCYLFIMQKILELPHKSLKNIPVKYRILIYLKSYFWARVYCKLGKIINKIMEK